MKAILTVIFLKLSVSVFSQMPNVVWQKNLGGSQADNLECILMTTDGGYLLGGYSISEISGDKTDSRRGLNDFWVIKLDSARNIEWQKTLGGNQNDILIDAVQCADGGYLLAGHSKSDISGEKSENSYGDYDYWIVRLDEFGNYLWDKTIGGDLEEKLANIVIHNDTTYVLAGHSISDSTGLKAANSEGDFDFWIVNIDNDGNILWQNTLGGSLRENLYSIEKTTDDGFIVGGDTESPVSGDKTTPMMGLDDYWIVKLDEEGNFVWDYSLGGDNQSVEGQAIQTTDGNYIIAGRSNCDIGGIKTEPNYNVSMWIIKLNEDGEVIWENTIGTEGVDYFTDIKPTLDGGAIISTHSEVPASIDQSEDPIYSDFWIIKLNEMGVIEWENIIKAGLSDDAPKIYEIAANEYLIGGSSSSTFQYEKFAFSRGQSDFWFMKLGNCEVIDNTVITHEFHGLPSRLEASADGPYEYQWYKCLEESIFLIPGETSKNFHPPYADFYMVRVSNGICETYSECTYGNSGVVNLNESQLNTIHAYPNPTSNTLFLACEPDVKAIFTNTLGEMVLTAYGNTISLENLEVGVYFLTLYNSSEQFLGTFKVVKN
jgi:hypothetical protein